MNHKDTTTPHTIAGRIAVQFPAYCDSRGRVGQQELDGALAAAVETSAWRMLRRRAEEAEQQLELQTAARLEAEAGLADYRRAVKRTCDSGVGAIYHDLDDRVALLITERDNHAQYRWESENKTEALMVALAQAVDELTEAQYERNKAEGLAEAYCATYRSTRCLWHATAAQRDDLHRDMAVQAEIITKLRHDLAVMTEARDVAVAVCDLARRDAADLADAVMQCGWLISALRALLLGLAGCEREESEDGMTVWYGVPSGLAGRVSGLAGRLRQQVEREKGGRRCS